MKQRLAHRDWAYFLLILLATFALHILAFGNTLVADDTYFAHALDSRTLAEYVSFRYTRWSGRLPIELALPLLVTHPWLWKLLNSLMVLLFCYSAGRISLARTGMSAAGATALTFALFMLISPAVLYESAWWMTGSINYLWPVALGLYGLLAFVGDGDNGNIDRLGFLLASGLAMYNEQVALVLLPASLLFLMHRIATRQWRGWDFAHVGFMSVNAIIVFTAPGSYRRYLSEQALRFPDFATLDLADKVAIGFGLTFRSTFDPSNLLIAVFAALAAMLLLRAPVGRLVKAIVFLAFAFLALNYLLPAESSLQSFYAPPSVGGASASSSRAYALSAWHAFVIACLVGAGGMALWRSRRECTMALMTLLLGLASLAAMGFSPTAYASGSRVHFVSQVAFLLVAARLFAASRQEFGLQASRVAFVLIALAAGYRVLQLLY